VTEEPTAAQLARLDQKVAAFNEGLDQLVKLAREYVAEEGAERATARVAHNLTHAVQIAGVSRVVGIAATALVRLAAEAES
jgi:hypothetical protein